MNKPNRATAATLTFNHLRTMNVLRCEHWHASGEPWDLEDWANATGGEVGEAQNVIKKLRRELSGTGGNAEGVTIKTLCVDLGNELADVFIYNDLTAYFAGLAFPAMFYDQFRPQIDRFTRGRVGIDDVVHPAVEEYLRIEDIGKLCDASGLTESETWKKQTLQGAGCSLAVASGKVAEMAGLQLATNPHFRKKFGEHVVNVAVMCFHVADQLQIDLASAVIDKFNAVSDRQSIDIYV